MARGDGNVQFKEAALGPHGPFGSLPISAVKPPACHVPWSLDMASAKIHLERLWFVLFWSGCGLFSFGRAADSSPPQLSLIRGHHLSPEGLFTLWPLQ